MRHAEHLDAAFLLALFFFLYIISTSPSSTGFSFLHPVLQGGQVEAKPQWCFWLKNWPFQPSFGLCLVLEDLEKLQRWLWGWAPVVTVREGSGGCDRTGGWICCLFPAQQWAASSLRAPVLAPMLQAFYTFWVVTALAEFRWALLAHFLSYRPIWNLLTGVIFHYRMVWVGRKRSTCSSVSPSF